MHLRGALNKRPAASTLFNLAGACLSCPHSQRLQTGSSIGGAHKSMHKRPAAVQQRCAGLAPRTASARDIAEAHTSICADGRGEEEGLHTSSLFVHIGYLQGPCMSLRPEGVTCLPQNGGRPACRISEHNPGC